MKVMFVSVFSSLIVFNSAFAALTASDLCKALDNSNAGTASSEEQEVYDLRNTEFEDNKKNASSDKYLYVRRNSQCPGDAYLPIGRSFLVDKEPCSKNKKDNDGRFCFLPWGYGIIDKAMIQEIGRARWGNLFNNANIQTTSVYYDSNKFPSSKETNPKVVNYTIDDGKTYGKRVYGQPVQGISDTALSSKDKAEKYCKHANTKASFFESKYEENAYVCDGLDEKLCDTHVAPFIEEIQQSPNDETIIGASAEWRMYESRTGDGNYYTCIITIP